MTEIFDTVGVQLPDGTYSKAVLINFQVTEDCNLCCTYCFQKNKSHKPLEWEDAKKFIDYLLTRTPENCAYMNPQIYHAAVFGFCGGDALMNIDLIEKILNYIVERMLELGHPWLSRWTAHMDTNGVLYYDRRVQRLLKRWPNALACTITLDGNKSLHDMCRIFPDGSGSYEYARAAIEDQFLHGIEPAGKMTVAPENVDYLYDAVLHMIDIGFRYVRCNQVYEDVWKESDARRYFDQCVKIADYLLDTDLYKGVTFPPLEEKLYDVTMTDQTENPCGGNGQMVDLSADGLLYNCYRYNRTSVSPKQIPYSIGSAEHGFGFTEIEQERIKTLQAINRKTCSPPECLECPVAGQCNYCNGENYYEFGDANKRTTFHCLIHSAGSLACAYYVNTIFRKEGLTKRWPVLCPKDRALKVLSEHEYNALVNYCKEV